MGLCIDICLKSAVLCILDNIFVYPFFFHVIPNICSLLLAVADLTLLPDEQILNENQPDMDDFVPCENQDEEAEAMVEESPSGI